jgi:hypothetical protein
MLLAVGQSPQARPRDLVHSMGCQWRNNGPQLIEPIVL